MVLPAVLPPLICPATLAGTGSVPQLLALSLEAVALPAVIAEADLEWSAALKAHDLDEIDQVRVVGHDAGEADLDNDRPEWEALYVTRQSLRLSRRLPGRSARSGRAPLRPACERVPPPLPLPAPDGAAYDAPSPLGISTATLRVDYGRDWRAGYNPLSLLCRLATSVPHRGSTP